MTCREKLKLEHPEKVGYPRFVGGCAGCPHDYGYLDKPAGCNGTLGCTACWDREIPGTETINKKENDIMPVKHTNHNKMTKTELIEEIEAARTHIQAMESQLKNLEKYRQYEEAADEIKAIHAALMNSGFTNEQAFDLLKTTIQSMMPTILRGMRV